MTATFPPRTVPPAKITDYLMNPRHEVGGSKADFFRRHGFSATGSEAMVAALLAHPDLNPVEETTSDGWGTRYVVRCTISTPDGRDPCIRTVWIVLSGEAHARLVTAFPA